MYFIFPDNLPASVQKAAFEFTSGQFPLYRYITPDTEILNRGISIAIPDEASHIRSIRLTTSRSHFTYYYPEKGYKIAQGIHLPPFRVPAVGDLYANGVIIQAGADSPGQHIEQTLDYFDALIYCESISEGTLDNWHLPDMLNLVLLHTRQREFNMFLAKYQGTFLYDEEYWCKDNSVIDLGVAFNMANSRLAICPKKEKRQVRAILDY